MKICIISRNFDTPWYPSEIDTFLSGCGECLTYFADSLKNDFGYEVDVFLRAESGKVLSEYDIVYKNIRYRDLMYLDTTLANYDIYISFRVNFIDDFFLDKKVIYWSSDIEDITKFKKGIFKHFVFLTNFHQSEQKELLPSTVIPHGINIQSLLENKCEKENGTVLYCSSIDRGFEKIITDWDKIMDNHPFLQFTVSYGSGTAKKYATEKKRVESEEKMKYVCESAGINYVADVSRKEIEQLYWKSQYWILPLNNKKSELFCLNALKAEIANCTPIINRIGALEETVSKYIPYENFIKGDMTIVEGVRTTEILPWKDVISKYWIPLFDKILNQ